MHEYICIYVLYIAYVYIYICIYMFVVDIGGTIEPKILHQALTKEHNISGGHVSQVIYNT